MKIGRFAFLRPPLGDLGATYDDHLRLIEKRVVDFLLALMKLFSLGVTAEELRAIIGWKSAISFQRGSVDPKFQVEGVAPTNHSSSQRTKINILSYGIKIWTDLSSVLSGMWQTDRQTDGRTDRNLLTIPRLHYMQRGKNVDVSKAFLLTDRCRPLRIGKSLHISNLVHIFMQYSLTILLLKCLFVCVY